MMNKSSSKNALVRQLYLCGQIAEHKSQKSQEHGKDEELIFSVLTEEEKITLSALLSKLQAQWAKDHAEHHKNG